MASGKPVVRRSLRDLQETLKRWDQQVDKLMTQEGGVLSQSRLHRHVYTFPDISYLKDFEYNTNLDGHNGVGFGFAVKTTPKNYGVGDRFDHRTGTAFQSTTDPIYLWDEDAEVRFASMLKQMRFEILKIRSYSDGRRRASKKQNEDVHMNKQQRQKMALAIAITKDYQWKQRSATGTNVTAGVTGVSKQVAKRLDSIIKVVMSVPGAKFSEKWVNTDLNKPRHILDVTWPDHLVIHSFSMFQDMDESTLDNPVYSAFFSLYRMPEINDPSGGVGFHMKTLSFAQKKISVSPSLSPSVAQFLRVIKSDLKNLTQLTDIVNNEGMSGLKSKKEDIRRKQEKMWEAKGFDLVKVPYQDEDRYRFFLKNRWVSHLGGHARHYKFETRYDSYQGVLHLFGSLVPSDVEVRIYVLGGLRKDEVSFQVSQKVQGSGTVVGVSYDPATRSVIPDRNIWFPVTGGEKLFSYFIKCLYNLKEAFAMAKSMPETPQKTEKPEGSFSSDDVRRLLRSSSFGPAGKARSVESLGEDGWSVDPQYRQRLDHFGNDGDGWDEDGWSDEYAGPVADAALARLESKFGKGLFYVDVGEKGHIDVTLTPKGKKLLV